MIKGNPSSQAAAPSCPMKISSIRVRNFRLLSDAEIHLSDITSVLVGRNNTGKTTLAEAATRFLQESSPKFTIADFSSEGYADFVSAFDAFRKNDIELARESIPGISIEFKIRYSKDATTFGPLASAIVDLDPDCTEAIVRFEYKLAGGQLKNLFEQVDVSDDADTEVDSETLLAIIAEKIPELFQRRIIAVDPNDESNVRELTIAEARRLITVHFLTAQRGLDDVRDKPREIIGHVFQNLFDSAVKAEEGTTQKQMADELATAVEDIEIELGKKVSKMMTGIIPAMQQFGYPGLSDPGIEAKTSLDVERLLVEHTRINYPGVAGVSLPESYSGLGSRNLILILFTLLGHYREYASRGETPGTHLLFIEEPEAHLHPQMQEVFIEQLEKITNLFPDLDGKNGQWWPQFIVTTHSSHVANRTPFQNVRYFLAEDNPKVEGKQTKVLDLSQMENVDVKFLHRYLTLTQSDLFFADKAILVEGTSERLIVPAAIRSWVEDISSQYVTLLEVGGSYAYKFFPLLDFLRIPALIITDIDTVGASKGKSKNSAVVVHRGSSTSNPTIKNWFQDRQHQDPDSLLRLAQTTEIIDSGRYLAYQIPEEGQTACGRSFEESFALANPELLGIELTGDAVKDEEIAYKRVKNEKKANFALKYVVDEPDWKPPLYIFKGLRWLLNYPNVNGDESVVAANAGAVVK